jgi:threonine aldolase
MFLHMDGARLSNAAEALGVDLREITADVGVDILSFGGTKNGMLIGEAVVLFNERLMKNFKYIRKQGMHLASKMRFISVQFLAFLNNDLWRRNARHANKMARIFADEMEKIPQCNITQKVEANALFVSLPRNIVDDIRKEHFFYIWDESVPVIRLMTSYDTEIEDIHAFIHSLKMKMGC